MLCTQVLNSLFTRARRHLVNPGKDFEVVVGQLRPEGAVRPGPRQEGRLHGQVQAAGHRAGFHFLTGDQTSIAPLLDTVGFNYQYDPAIDQYAHPAMIAVLTPDGRISKYFLGIDYSAARPALRADRGVRGPHRVAGRTQVITWCYHYDPTTGTYGLLTMRLVQAGGIAFIVAMLTFWTVMWRRERATAAA